MSIIKTKNKKAILIQFMKFIYILCALHAQTNVNVSAMELPKMSHFSKRALGNADILSCIFPYVQLNDSKDIYHFCTTNKKLNRKWKSRKFLKNLLIHPEYLVGERMKSRQYLQCALLNENYISRLSKSISIEFVDSSKKRLDDDDHDIELTSTLAPSEILDILYKLYKTKKMFSQYEMPVFPSNVLWPEWCAKGIFLAYKNPSPYPPRKVREKFASVLGLRLTSEDWNASDTQQEKWIRDLNFIKLDHPNAALMYAFFATGFCANFWCNMPSKEEILIYVGTPKRHYFRDTKDSDAHDIEIKNCFALAIKSGITMSHDVYKNICIPIYNHKFLGLDIAHLQEQHLNSLVTNTNSQDQKK